MSSTVTLPPTKKYPDGKRQWDLKFIWEASNDFKKFEISVGLLWGDRYSKAWCWQNDDEVINNEFFLHHLERVMTADLSYPIVLSEESYILDGVHRLMKAKYLGIENITCVQFETDPPAKSPNKGWGW